LAHRRRDHDLCDDEQVASLQRTSASVATLPDGLVAFVKRDCPTCVLVEPVLAALAASGRLTAVFTQDDPGFPALDITRDDTDLAVSYHAGIEVVPTLMIVDGGVEQRRVVGWSRDQWAALTAMADLAADIGITDHRPGCGSLTVDPDRVDALEARFGDGFVSRRVEIATTEDEIEAMYDRGWSDGLPLVPPTPERVRRMLEGTSRPARDIVAVVPPNLVEASVEKVAINAVMAGCRPEYLPVVIAALEAACTDTFNLHGVLATTMPVGPVLFVNGPIRQAIGMNSGGNVLGQGNRANSTIGRAVQLVVRNVGGGRPGEVDRATHGSPAKVGLCFAEDEEGSPWASFAADLGYGPEQSTVTVFPGEAPHLLVDQLSRDPDALAHSMAMVLIANGHPKLALGSDAILVIGPDHANRFRDARWSKQQLIGRILDHTQRPAADLRRGVGGVAEGMPADLSGSVPKFRPDGGLIVLHAGGGAGLFSAIITGWSNGPRGSQYTTKEILP
jgi:hypothetical protein